MRGIFNLNPKCQRSLGKDNINLTNRLIDGEIEREERWYQVRWQRYPLIGAKLHTGSG